MLAVKVLEGSGNCLLPGRVRSPLHTCLVNFACTDRLNYHEGSLLALHRPFSPGDNAVTENLLQMVNTLMFVPLSLFFNHSSSDSAFEGLTRAVIQKIGRSYWLALSWDKISTRPSFQRE